MTAARPPAVAGSFYPGEPARLRASVRELLAGARAELGEAASRAPKAVIVPHAGYVYSGATAALGFAALAAGADLVRRVVLLGPCHRVAVRGLALPGAPAMATPLGEVPVDEAGVAALATAGLPFVGTSAQAHAQEHSLEVQLPFLAEALPEAAVVPLAVGRATPSEVAAVLDVLWGGPETAFVVSSDLSHYLPSEQARAVDEVTIAQVLDSRGPLTHEQACGATPVNGLMLAAAEREMTPTLLGACNSGDTAGDRERVVGYAAFAYDESGRWSS